MRMFPELKQLVILKTVHQKTPRGEMLDILHPFLDFAKRCPYDDLLSECACSSIG